MKKTQIWYMDLVIAITIFTLMLVVAFKFISEGTLLEDRDSNSVFIDSEKLSQTLMTSGYPINWTEESVIVIGLVNEGNVINLSKLSSLKEMTINDYDKTKRILGLRSDYLIYFIDKQENLLDLAGQDYISNGETLQDVIDKSPENMITTTRHFVYKHENISEIIGMKVVVWQE